MAIEYGFKDQLVMSQGVSASSDVREVLISQIPGAVNAYQAATVNDRQGIDWWVEMSTAKHLAVDVKVRSSDWAATHPDEDDLALETWSVVESKVIGWTRDANKKCDYVLWLWKDTGRFCLIPFLMLCRVFSDKWVSWRDEYKTRMQRTTGQCREYHSECVFVPRAEVWRQIYRTYGGDLKISSTSGGSSA